MSTLELFRAARCAADQQGVRVNTGKTMLKGAALAMLLGSLGGCSSYLIDMRPGARNVAVFLPEQVTACESKGNILVSVLSNVGFFDRSDDAVEGNLLQLARNGAIDAGGDTVVKGVSKAPGTRTFAIYKCRS
jgi:hypothetical protein